MLHNNIMPFAFGDSMVRVHMDEQHNPWFVAKDVCAVLDIINDCDAVSNLDDDERSVGITDTLGGHQQMMTISESGLYSLIFRSRKPEAKRFRKWITSEVLPSIRNTSGYMHTTQKLEREVPPMPILPTLEALPDEALRLRPSVRAQLWKDSLQAARLEGAGMAYAIECFKQLCIIMGAVHPSEYATQQEDVQQFINECCLPSDETTSFADLYEAFRHWRTGNGDMPSKKVFGSLLEELIGRQRSNGSRYSVRLTR